MVRGFSGARGLPGAPEALRSLLEAGPERANTVSRFAEASQSIFRYLQHEILLNITP